MASFVLDRSVFLVLIDLPQLVAAVYCIFTSNLIHLFAYNFVFHCVVSRKNGHFRTGPNANLCKELQ